MLKAFKDWIKKLIEIYENFGFIGEEEMSDEDIALTIELRELEHEISPGRLLPHRSIKSIEINIINPNQGAIMNPVIYSPDAIILPDIGITKLTIQDAPGGGTLDTFPIANPDGWVIRPDSPYLNVDEFGGQKTVQSDMQLNKVLPYPAYDPAKPEYKLPPFNGKPWTKLVAYVKYFAHFHKPQPNAVKGWHISIECEVNSTNAEFLAWATTRSKAGYDDDVAVEFVSGQIFVNTKYTFASSNEDAQVGYRPTGSGGTHGVLIKLFIPTANKAVAEKFITDLAAWQVAPKLKKITDMPGLLVFSR